ncbi:MAG: hypothetical protein K6G42_09475 [Lachnospiraceae bacterium]|nr:hypothetical protein [Lachnospiraceae bacterium]
MKERTRLSSGNMLLLELLFALIFFSLTLSVTLSVFGKAYAISLQAEGKEAAVAESNDVAEIIRSASGESEIKELLKAKGVTEESDGHYSMIYGDGRYRMEISTSVKGKLYTADIACYDPKNPDASLYDLKVEHALKEGSDDGR